ncbi:MAG: hypothetical protein ABI687_05090 [Flavitalea sp.]
MRPRLLGFLLATLGFAGMFLAGYLFVTGSGGRGHLIEVTSYLIVGAVCFFAGINYIYESNGAFTKEDAQLAHELEEITPIQQQWRSVHIAHSRPSGNNVNSALSPTGKASAQNA